jgi:hypothetical protein
MQGAIIPNVTAVRDLGVLVEADLRFDTHINNLVRASTTRIKLISKCFVTRQTFFLLRMYKTFVRPILEYATEIWCPSRKESIWKIEKVQKYFTRLVCGDTGMNYEERLHQLDMCTLERRRAERDAIMVWKIMNGRVNLNEDVLCSTPHAQLYVPLARSKAYRECFSVRAAKIYNQIPPLATNTRSLTTFKRSLESARFRDLHVQI